MKCWILTKIILIQIGFNNYGKNVIIRMSHSRRILVVISCALKILLVEEKAHCNRSKGEI
jgi:hypothetical protein